jgi:glutathione S-transferase
MITSSLTLYDCATAPSPRRARIFLAEKGVAHEVVQIDLKSGQQLSEAYRAINPQCTVPALRIEDGAVLTDNAAIAAYLEARYPEPPLMGMTPLDIAEIASWQWRVEFEGLMPIAHALRNSSPAMANRALPGPVNYAQIPALAERGRHHRRRGCRFCESCEGQTWRAASAFAALASEDGRACLNGTLEPSFIAFCTDSRHRICAGCYLIYRNHTIM